MGPTQQVVDNLPLQDLCDYKKVGAAVLKMLNLNPEAYQQLQEIEFGLDYHPCLIDPHIRATCV